MKAVRMPIFQPRKVDSIFDEVKKMEDRITARAYELFLSRGANPGSDLDDWLIAESELTRKPAVELCEKPDEFVLEAALAGVDPEDLDVQVTPDQLLVKAEMPHRHKDKDGTVHRCEFQPGRIFRCVQLPKKIDPERVTADYRNGLLTVHAAFAKAELAKKVEIAAAS